MVELRRQDMVKKETLVIIWMISLVASTWVYHHDVAGVLESPINIDLSNTLNPEDFPIGIDCTDPDFAYVTIFEQGLLAKINKNTREVVEIIDDPDGPVDSSQGFYGIAYDQSSGAEIISEAQHGKAWRFDPFAAPEDAWTRIPLIGQISHESVSYPFGYDVRPDVIQVEEGPGIGAVVYNIDVSSLSTAVFSNDFIYIGITYAVDFDDVANALGIEDMSFSGLARIDPNTLEVMLIPIPDAGQIAGLSADFEGVAILVVDKTGDKVYLFDTFVFEVVDTFSLPPGSEPNYASSDDRNIYVALNKRNPTGTVAEDGPFSEIAMIDKSTHETAIINTGAPNSNVGTFSVYVINDLLVWTDQSGHVGMFDLSSGIPVAINDETTGLPFITTGDSDSNHFGCIPMNTSDFAFWVATRASAKVVILADSDFTDMGEKKTTTGGPLTFINIDLNQTSDPDDFPFGIDCGTVDDQFVYVTIFRQGLLAKINKVPMPDGTHAVQLIDDPEGPVENLQQGFYSVARDPNTGNLFINEVGSGRAWRFDPSAPAELAWTRIPLIEQIINERITYPFGYEVRPSIVDVDGAPGSGGQRKFFQVTSVGTVVFANGFIWIGLTYNIDFEEPGLANRTFSGIVRINPNTLDFDLIGSVTRFEIPGAGLVAGINVDSVDSSVLWITERDPVGGVPDGNPDRLYRFDINALQVVQTILLPDGSESNHVDTDTENIFVALNKPRGIGEDVFSEIAQINRSTLELTIINTGAPNTEGGTFTVFVNNDLLAWTDRSGHVGIIELITGENSFQTTGDFDSNHFGCVPFDGEFWFASRGSAKVGILPNSKFSGGRPVRPISPTSTGGGGGGIYRGRTYAFGDPDSARYDDESPVVANVMIQQGSMKVSALINDNVGVKEASLIINKSVYPMNPHDGNPLWWVGIIPSADLTGNTIFFKILAKDYSNNTGEYEGSAEVPAGSRTPALQGASFVITPLSAVGQSDPNYSIAVNGISANTQNINPQITIKNTSNELLKNIRIMLSPELKGKFLLSDYAVKIIAPNAEHTISLIMNGKPNVDEMGDPIPYNGHVIISVDNRTPVLLQLSGEVANESALIQSMFMKMLESKAEKRYKSFEKPDTRISESDSRYEVTLGSGNTIIRAASDELIIRNTSNEPLKNIRIATSAVADHFLLEHDNIASLPAGSFIKVKIIPKLNNAVSRDLSGELLIAPENATPLTMPIVIGKKVQEDKNAMYEVRTISGNTVISSTSDTIVIRNNSEETIDNVRIILPRELARIFSLSEDAVRSIEPNSEHTIHISMRGTSDSTVKQILQDYSGDIIIVSTDGMKKIMPVNIIWKSISSEHFVIYARDNAEELDKAKQVINFLERNYAEVKTIVGEASTKTVIYITGSSDELMPHHATSSAADAGFIYSNSEDINMLALKEFVRTTIMQNYGTYWTKQKISLDNGNWLVDGISNYIAAKIVGERGIVRNQLDSFLVEPTSFEWYGSAEQSQYGASYILFNFLAERYGDTVIGNILNNLGSAMVSNDRCETIEQCALLEAVYDANGPNKRDKKHDPSFSTIMEEWKDYLKTGFLERNRTIVLN